jgi:hypothetical protein
MNKNTSGYILYTLLIVSSISFIIFLVIVYAIRSALHISSHTIGISQAHYLAQSGIARAEYFLNGNDGHSITWETDNFEETLTDFGTIHISVKPFGLFSRILSIGKRYVFSDSLQGLTGRTIPTSMQHTLVLTSVSGGCLFLENTSVQGTIVLHHGYITNKPHGRRPVPGYEKRVFTIPSPRVPFDSIFFAKKIESMFNTVSLKYETSTSVKNITAAKKDTSDSSTTVSIEGDLHIESTVSHKNYLVTGTAYLTEKASCKDILLKAQKISINGSHTEHSLFVADSGISVNGGYHNSQFIATDSIIVTGDAGFGLANCIATLRNIRKDSTFTGGIYIKSEREIKGTIISLIDPKCVESKMVPYDVSISLKPGFRLKGYIITDHDVDIQKGTIEGGVWTRSVLTKYNSISYTNALIGMSMKPLKEGILFPLIGDPPINIVISEN